MTPLAAMVCVHISVGPAVWTLAEFSRQATATSASHEYHGVASIARLLNQAVTPAVNGCGDVDSMLRQLIPHRRLAVAGVSSPDCNYKNLCGSSVQWVERIGHGDDTPPEVVLFVLPRSSDGGTPPSLSTTAAATVTATDPKGESVAPVGVSQARTEPRRPTSRKRPETVIVRAAHDSPIFAPATTDKLRPVRITIPDPKVVVDEPCTCQAPVLRIYPPWLQRLDDEFQPEFCKVGEQEVWRPGVCSKSEPQ
jgi:hypothetical protein